MIVRRLWPAIIWAVIILVLTGVPGKYFPKVVTFWEWLTPDKIVHIIIFGIQVILILYGVGVQFLNAKKRYVINWIIVLSTLLFAMLTEVLQAYVFIGRHGNVYDFLADAVGVGIGFLAYYLLILKKKGVGN